MQSYRKRDTFTDLFKKWQESKKPKTEEWEEWWSKEQEKNRENFEKMVEEATNNNANPSAPKPRILDSNLEGDELEKQLREEFNANFRTWKLQNPRKTTNDWFDETIERLKKEPKLYGQINNQEQQEDITSKYKDYSYDGNPYENNRYSMNPDYQYNYPPYNYTPYRKKRRYKSPKLNYDYDNIDYLIADNSRELQLNFDYSEPYQPQRRRYNLHTYRYRPYLRYGYYY